MIFTDLKVRDVFRSERTGVLHNELTSIVAHDACILVG